jgi:hypothetical protein
MSADQRMKKDRRSKLQLEMVNKKEELSTKGGRSSTLIKLQKPEPRVSTKNSVSILTDHSISDQECQCKELLNATEPATFG